MLPSSNCDRPPFTRCEALNTDSIQSADPASMVRGGGTDCDESFPHVPDYPLVPLDYDSVNTFLSRELETRVLDQLYESLWIVSRMSGDNIDQLHANELKSRRIILSEDPAMHLVWFGTRIFIKPIPVALLNHDFWNTFLTQELTEQDPAPLGDLPSQRCFDQKIALGFMRSYSRLIKHRSDLEVAIEKRLVPANVTWLAWCRFIAGFQRLRDEEVANRYHFGQLRLTRLNFLVRILRPKGMRNHRHYKEMYWDTGSYLERFFAPFLFIFASLSLALSAWQVILGLPLDQVAVTQFRMNVVTMKRAAWNFGLLVLVLLAICWALLIFSPLVYLSAQVQFGYKLKRFQKRNMKPEESISQAKDEENGR
ncbi:hypothetical protein VE00_03490 [Pseudogymnoascus sp. WSF 3629]|nr:hypothetical protein VE00_03490 [Pseudogymnoascus sp. WSF 3629]